MTTLQPQDEELGGETQREGYVGQVVKKYTRETYSKQATWKITKKMEKYRSYGMRF